jgi:hypothetical protein
MYFLKSTSEQARFLCPLALLLISIGCTAAPVGEQIESKQWLAGDHHIHSRYSVRWDMVAVPPVPKIGGDAIYPIPMNALMAKHFGLAWTVATDHGGREHAKINLERAYPELVQSRVVVPELIQFYGMELNTPAADHSSLIIPHSPEEAVHLHALESTFDAKQAFPPDLNRNTEARMIEALDFMQQMSPRPVVIANHPSRSALAMGEYGLHTPAEFRSWNDTAPDVAVGMAGAPGHQAITLNPDGSTRPYPRGGYRQFPTMGAFDQMTARLGGFWDSMLGEGRRWWITANSDSHIHYTEGGYDFWPGEYSKTYVFAEKNHDSIIEALRKGRVFVTTGDLISELNLTVSDGKTSAMIGEELNPVPGANLNVTIKIRDPATDNHHGDNPKVNRVDLIVGNVTGKVTDRSQDTNDSTRVVKRFSKKNWQRRGEYLTMTYSMENVSASIYLRVRGTNTGELEPEPDPFGENPWQDLWFYSNPVFVEP